MSTLRTLAIAAAFVGSASLALASKKRIYNKVTTKKHRKVYNEVATRPGKKIEDAPS